MNFPRGEVASYWAKKRGTERPKKLWILVCSVFQKEMRILFAKYHSLFPSRL